MTTLTENQVFFNYPVQKRIQEFSNYYICIGMTDIARQTVEFLYEENGGMPRDLQLPTIEDIREDLAKFTIERVRKGTMVLIRTLPGSSPAGTTVLPKYAVRGMLKTFSLPGIVLDVDQVTSDSTLANFVDVLCNVLKLLVHRRASFF